jgi:hypothetical protein
MSARRLVRSLVLAWVLGSIGCSSDSLTDSPPACVPVDVAGVWDVHWEDDGTGTTSCYDVPRVWTIQQSGCAVTISSEDFDPANGAAGSARDGRISIEWTWYQTCHGFRESIDAVVDGDTMSGTFYRAVWQEVYPAYCPGSGLCSAVLTGTRRTPA